MNTRESRILEPQRAENRPKTARAEEWNNNQTNDQKENQLFLAMTKL
jgi:hypothetical protein